MVTEIPPQLAVTPKQSKFFGLAISRKRELINGT